MVYEPSKKWCSQCGHELVYFDATSAVAHRKANEGIYTLSL